MVGHIHYEKSDPSCNAMDYPAHEETYTRFTGLVKWGIIAALAVLALMAIFLT